MMNRFYIVLFISVLISGCQKKQDYQIDSQTMQINDFVWKAMNAMYLWKDNVADLSDYKFKNQGELNQFLENFTQPDHLFKHLIYERDVVDRWSWIVDDYEELLRLFQGVRTTTGMRIGLVYEPGSTTNLFAYVRYVIPNSDAYDKGVQRGHLFRKINGTYLTVDNYRELLSDEQLSIELAQWNGTNLQDTGNIISLQKSVVGENPIYIKEVFIHNGKKIGYLMYNGFITNYEQELNDTFAYFKSENIDKLIVDLRYNPGGSVQTMTYLASMITGQFSGQVFLKYQWHSQLQQWMFENRPETLSKPFISKMSDNTEVNSLHLNEVYFIATKSSASASESLMNCLKPYINVIHIGTETHGKYTASITMFDSPDFSRQQVNKSHKWALQPIVLKVSNTNGESDFINGLPPDVYQQEDYFNLGILGQSDEPLLQTVLNYIDNQTFTKAKSGLNHREIYYKEHPLVDEMYLNFETEGIKGVLQNR